MSSCWFKVAVVSLLVFGITMTIMNYNLSNNIHVYVFNAISAVVASVIFIYRLYESRKYMMKEFDRMPWGSGFVFAASFGIFTLYLNTHSYSRFLDYTFAIMVMPMAMLLMYTTGYGHILYLEKKNIAAEARETRKLKLPPPIKKG